MLSARVVLNLPGGLTWALETALCLFSGDYLAWGGSAVDVMRCDALLCDMHYDQWLSACDCTI